MFDMSYVLGTKQVDEMREGKKVDAMDFYTTGILQVLSTFSQPYIT